MTTIWGTLRVCLSSSAPLQLSDVPPLSPVHLPSARLASLLPHSGLSRLRACLVSDIYSTLWFFTAHGWRPALSYLLAFLLSFSALALVPIAVELLLHALEAQPTPNAALCWQLVGGLCCAYAVYAAAAPATVFYGMQWAQCAEAALLALVSAKSALLPRSARSMDDAGMLMGSSGAVSAFTPLIRYDLVGTTLGSVASTAIATVFLGRLLGAVTTLSALALVLLLTVLQAHLRVHMKVMDKDAKRLSKVRVGLLTEGLPRLLDLRCMQWKEHFGSRVAAQREAELARIRSAQHQRVGMEILVALLQPLAVLLTFLVFAATHGGALPTPATAFAAVTWLAYLGAPLKRVGYFLQNWQTASIAQRFLREFLLREEASVAHMAGWCGGGSSSSSSSSSGGKREGSASAGFAALEQSLAHLVRLPTPSAPAPAPAPDGSSPLLVLEARGGGSSAGAAPQLRVEPGKITLLLGRSGSGKSTLLMAAVGDAESSFAALRVHSQRAVYVPQDPWLQAGSVRDCITGYYATVWGGGEGADAAQQQLGGLAAQPVDEDWLKLTLKACALNSAKEPGLLGLAGQLSGGQKARLALARAVYNGARPGMPSTLFLLDDIFAALDRETGNKVWERCIKGLLKERGHGVLLATHALRFAEEGRGVAQVAVLEGHALLGCGRLADMKVHMDALRACSEGGGSPQLPMLGSSGGGMASPAVYPRADESAPDGEGPAPPSSHTPDAITAPSLSSFLAYARATPRLPMVLALYAATQAALLGQSFWLRAWVTGTYGTALPPWVWGAVGSSGPPTTPAAPAAIYGALGALVSLTVLLRMLLFNASALTAARVLHERALSGVLNAPASILSPLLTKAKGIVLARFEGDLSRLDWDMRWTSVALLSTSFSLLGTAVAVAFTSPYLLLWLALLALVFACFGRLYRRVILALSGCESSHYSGLTGLWGEVSAAEAAAMVRGGGPGCAAGVVASVLAAQVPRLRASLASEYGSSIASSALFVLSATVMVGAATAAVVLVGQGRLESSSASLLLSLCFTFPEDIRSWMENSSTFESSIISVRRVVEFGDLPSEDAAHAPLLQAAARGRGPLPPTALSSPPALELSGVFMRYSAGAEGDAGAASAKPSTSTSRDELAVPLLLRSEDVEQGSSSPPSTWVLKGLTVAIPAGAKVAVTGGSGCGKSSLFSTLLRLWPHEEGTVRVGGVDLGALPSADAVRQRFAFLPQSGLVLRGSVRENLVGPLTLPPDWDDERLLRFCCDVSPRLGERIYKNLDAQVLGKAPEQPTSAAVKGGAGACAEPPPASAGEWSKGERALLSVARLLLEQEVRGSAAAQVLLLDEPSADVDQVSDSALQQVLQGRAETVLCIVHRRENLRYFTHELALKDGIVSYFGPPP